MRTTESFFKAKAQKNELSVSYFDKINILRFIIIHLDLESIGNLRTASKKLKETTDAALLLNIDETIVDVTKENISKLLDDLYFTEGVFVSSEEKGKLVEVVPNFTKNLSTYAILCQFSEARTYIQSQAVSNSLRNFKENLFFLASIINRIIFYMENYDFSSQTEKSLFAQHLPEFIHILMICSDGETKKLEDVLLFCFILNVFHREIKKYDENSWKSFLVTFEAFAIESFSLQFLRRILSTAQVHRFLKKYQFEKSFAARSFYRALFNGETINHINFDILQLIANFYKIYKSLKIIKIQICVKDFCSYLIPAIIQYYYADHVIVSVKEATNVFEVMGLTQINLTNLPRLETFSLCLAKLYREKIFGISPNKQCSLMFHFLWNFISLADLSKSQEWLVNATDAMIILLNAKETKLSEIRYLFTTAKLYGHASYIAKALVIVEENKQSSITIETVKSWVEQFPVLIPKKFRKGYKIDGLIYQFTTAVLTLSNMQLLDTRGKVIEQLKSLTFGKNYQPEIISYLSSCFDENVSLPEIGEYFLKKKPNEFIEENGLIRLACLLVKKQIIPQVINFSEFWELFLCLEDISPYFEDNLIVVFNNYDSKLVRKEFFHALIKFLVNNPLHIIMRGRDYDMYEKSNLLKCVLEIYLFNLSIKKEMSLESIFDAWKPDVYFFTRMTHHFEVISTLYESKKLSLENAQGLAEFIFKEYGHTYLVEFELFLNELAEFSNSSNDLSNAIANIFLHHNYDIEFCLKLLAVLNKEPEQGGKLIRELVENKYDKVVFPQLLATVDELYKPMRSSTDAEETHIKETDFFDEKNQPLEENAKSEFSAPRSFNF